MLSGVFHLHEQEARQVMTPIPAVVTVDISETVETALRPLHLLRPHAPGRHRGREPGPRQGHRPRQLAGPEADGLGARRVDRAAGARRADRPRDQAARRPARRAAAPAHLDGRRRRRVRAASPASSRSRTSSRRSWGRSTTRPTRPAARCASSPTATGSCAATSPVTDLARLRPRAAGRHRRLQLGRRLRVRRARAPAAARRHGHRQRLLDPGRVGAREPHRGRAHPQRRAARLNAAAPNAPSLAALTVVSVRTTAARRVSPWSKSQAVDEEERRRLREPSDRP